MTGKRKKTALISCGATAVFTMTSYLLTKAAIVRKEPDSITPDTDIKFDKQIRKSFAWYETSENETVGRYEDDGIKLIATLVFPPSDLLPEHFDKGHRKKFVICVHGYRSNREREFIPFVRTYAEHGFHVLMPDNRGHGDSEGKYICFGLRDSKDILGWTNYLINRFGEDIDIFYHGISMGAATVLMAQSLPLPSQVKAMVSDCAYTSQYDEIAFLFKEQYHLPKFPLFYSMNLFNKKMVGNSFKEASALKAVENAGIPVLFIHGDEDRFVPTYMVYELYNACASKKELWVAKEAAHAMSHVLYEEKYDKKVLEWFSKAL